MIQNKNVFIVLVLFLLLPLWCTAEIDPVSLVFKQGQVADIKVPCVMSDGINTNKYCAPSMSCNITIRKPDTSVMVNNALMTRNMAYYNYTLAGVNTSVVGTYQMQVLCSDGLNSGFDFSEFQISNSGMSGIGKDTVVPAIVLIAILLFCGFMAWSLPDEDNPLRLLFLGIGMFLLLIMLQYANLATNEDTVGLTNLLNMTYTILLWVIIFVASYFLIVKFLAPLLNNINKIYKERKEGKGDEGRHD